MNTKNFTLAGIAGGITFFMLGWLVYGVILMDTMKSFAGSATGVDRGEDMLLWSIFLGNLASGFLLSFIFTCLGTINNPTAGARAGFWIGLLMGAGFDFTMYGTSNISTLTGVLIDIVVFAFLTALSGAVVAWVIGKAKA